MADDKEATEARTRAAVLGYLGAWRDNDRGALLEVFAEEAQWFDPVGTEPWRGSAKIAEFWDQAHAGAQEFEPRVERIVVCGNEAIALFRMIVRFVDGRGMALDVCDQFVVDDEGRVVVAKAFWDQDCTAALDEC